MLIDDKNHSPAGAQLKLLQEIRDMQKLLLTKVETIEHQWAILEERLDSISYAIQSQTV